MASLFLDDESTDSDGGTSVVVEFPSQLQVELTVRDRETIQELLRHVEGRDRDAFAADALRIGVLALRQARGQLDADLVQREVKTMLSELQSQLTGHATAVQGHLTRSLGEYFDPKSGRFQERVERLVKEGGELEQLLRRQIGGDDSDLAKTLAAHVGEQSPLFKLLSPDESKGLMKAIETTLEAQLTQQRTIMLGQFSLDDDESALARLVRELKANHGELTTELQDKIDAVVKEFSLDKEDSALNRLVKNVDRAQQTITRQFSLDDDASALSRLKKELLQILSDQSEENQEFQREVRETLQSLVVRRQEAERSTRHGLEFEMAVGEFLERHCQQKGDILVSTGNETGLIKNCKVGDFIIELGPDSAAPGARIVVEAKEKQNYSLVDARKEIDSARQNRGGQIGLFIFSKKSAPTGLEIFARYGDDLYVVWDAENGAADIQLLAALTTARYLCIRENKQNEAQAADFLAVDAAILEIEKKTNGLSDISKAAESIQSNSETIRERVRIMQDSLRRQIAILQEKVADFKKTFETPTE